MWQHGGMARVTRAESKERTRQRLLAEAQRLFRERGYAATSLEQIAEAAEVTKGAIYGHFASKEDLMLSAIEAVPAPDYLTTLNDESRPLPERLAEFGRAVAAEDPGDTEELAVYLEFYAALLRAPDARQRYSSRLEGRLRELAGGEGDESDEGAAATPVQAWAIGQALLAGLQIYKHLAPGLVTPEVFERAFGLLAHLDQEPLPTVGRRRGLRRMLLSLIARLAAQAEAVGPGAARQAQWRPGYPRLRPRRSG
jgi:AcrR family transcriptional regulator